MVQTMWQDMLGGGVRYYTAGTVRTRALEAGEEAPLILLHGLSGHAETFVRNVVPLGAHRHVFAIDMIGHGLTDKPDLRYNIPTFVEHVALFMDAAGIGRASLGGQSLGGWVAQWFALTYPQRVEKLVLATSAGFQLDESQRQESARIHTQVRNVTTAALSSPTPQSVRQRLEWLMYRPETVTEELVQVRLHMYTRPDAQKVMPQVVRDSTGELNTEYMLTPQRLRSITAPTLILWTWHNPTTSLDVAQEASRYFPQAEFHVIEEAAHWPQFEQPEEFNRLVTEFLQR